MTKHVTTRVQAWLHEVPLFEGCSADELRWIDSLLTEITVPAGHTVTRQGRGGREFVLVGDGRASVARDGEDVAEIGPGSLVGELAIVDRAPRAATVTAVSTMRLLVGGAREFADLLDVPVVAARIEAAAAAHRRGEPSWLDGGSTPMPGPEGRRWGRERAPAGAGVRLAW